MGGGIIVGTFVVCMIAWALIPYTPETTHENCILEKGYEINDQQRYSIRQEQDRFNLVMLQNRLQVLPYGLLWLMDKSATIEEANKKIKSFYE